MSLNEWQRFGWLMPHNATKDEIGELLAVAERDIHDAKTRGLSEDWRFGIAYNAALQLARVALLASGYQTLKGDSHHFRSLDSLQFTLNIDSVAIDMLQTFRKKRAAGVYEAVGRITNADAVGMLSMAEALRQQVQAFLKSKHPALLP